MLAINFKALDSMLLSDLHPELTTFFEVLFAEFI